MRRTIIIFWRVWFYFLCSVPVIVFFIPLAIFLLLPFGYKYVYWVARNIWSPLVLFGSGFWIKRLNKFPFEGFSKIIVANHSSYIDIMLMFRMTKTPFVFVGKKEIVKIPIFGYLYKRAAITVDRNSAKSRFEVYEEAQKLIDKGYSICIFPETNYLDESILLNPFKKGAFKLAIEHKLPIFPIVFYDCKRKFPWYAKYGYGGVLRVEALELINTQGLKEGDIESLSLKVHKQIKKRLLSDPQQSSVNAIELWKKGINRQL